MAKVISNLADKYQEQDNDPRMNNLLHEVVGWIGLIVILYAIFS